MLFNFNFLSTRSKNKFNGCFMFSEELCRGVHLLPAHIATKTKQLSGEESRAICQREIKTPFRRGIYVEARRRN